MIPQDFIYAETKKLKALKEQVPARTSFGDDNHGAIDAQIAVLEQGLSSEQINERYGDDDNLRLAAVYAYDWKFKREEKAPSLEWNELVGVVPADLSNQEAALVSKLADVIDHPAGDLPQYEEQGPESTDPHGEEAEQGG
jgi:hypothetical protein